MEPTDHLPVAIIGAGPVGLAAAAHLVQRGMQGVVLEAGPDVGSTVRDWGHVALFSPWRYVVDHAARALLEEVGWSAPEDDLHPTGAELVVDYMEPLARHPKIASMLRTRSRVVSVTRLGTDKLRDAGRERRPFELRLETAQGPARLQARAVIDATGTWRTPNPIGASGVPVPGEREHASRITYGIPDVRGAEAERFAGRRVAVIGSGHSAQNVVRELAAASSGGQGGGIHWLVRRDEAGQMFGGGAADQLPARGRLGSQARALVDAGAVHFVTGFRAGSIQGQDGGLTVVSEVGDRVGPVDEIVVATGFRPDLDMLRELRLDLDPVVESTRQLAPLIDPNVHSCGSVPPHGHRELEHAAEPGVYVVGAKSYGRAPTFLLATGYEQARSVVAALAGDLTAADDVQLDLPATGVCSTGGSGPVGSEPAAEAAACCGTASTVAAPASDLAPAPVEVTTSRSGQSACCAPEAPAGTPALVGASSCCG